MCSSEPSFSHQKQETLRDGRITREKESEFPRLEPPNKPGTDHAYTDT